jgi:hypothetical protein
MFSLALLLPTLIVSSAFAWMLPRDAASDLLPHLVADPPGRVELDVEHNHLLLRFDGYVHNGGPGPLEVRGHRASASVPMVAYQRIYRTDGTHHDQPMPGAHMVYARADGHHHWHLQRIVGYSLWNFTRTKLVAPAMKVGFCLADHQHVDLGIGPTKPVYTDAHGRAFCQKNHPKALDVWEGVSAGWRDLYDRKLVFQWVDVTNVQPGVYWLREDVDPDRFLAQAGTISPPAYGSSPTTIPGYDPMPLTVTSKARRGRVAIVLLAKRYGPTGSAQYRVVTRPRHGRLSIRIGALLNHATVIYRPDRGYRGTDQFRYIALDSASSYPRHRVAATVTVDVGAA